MTRHLELYADALTGQVCWMWWAAEPEDSRRLLLEALAVDRGQSPAAEAAAPQLMAEAARA
jgi:hypothetical protein